MDKLSYQVHRCAADRVSRRSALRLLGVSSAATLVSPLLAGCGGSAPAPPSPASNTPTAGAAPTASRAAAPLANTPVTASGTPLTTFVTPPAVSTPTVATSTKPVKGGTLHLAMTSDPDALDPAKTIQLLADSINDSIYDRLVFIGSDRLPHPWVAEKWDISSDGTQITFRIRPGMTFHDGTPLDGAAVKFSFDRILDPKTASPAKAQMGSLQSVDLADPMSVVFKFKEPYAPFFTNISLGYGGIVSPTAVKKHGDAFGHNPVGSGPFKLKEWVAGQHLALERNPAYVNYRTDDPNRGAPYLDVIDRKIIADAPTRLAALQSGELDISDVDQHQVPTIQTDPKYQIIIWKEATNHNFLEYANKAPFTDIAVRQAIAYSIDRASIVKAAWNSYATPNLNPMPVGVAGWDARIGEKYGYPYNLDKAKKALADGGYVAGSDGVLQKAGKPLAWTLMVYSASAPAKTASEIIQATLNSIGMKVQLQIVEFGTELPMLKAGKFDVDWMRWTWPDPVIESLLFKSPGWTNQMHDPALDKLCAAADATLNPEERVTKVHAVEQYILEHAYIAPIATDWLINAARASVKGYNWDAIGYPRYVNVWLAR